MTSPMLTQETMRAATEATRKSGHGPYSVNTTQAMAAAFLAAQDRDALAEVACRNGAPSMQVARQIIDALLEGEMQVARQIIDALLDGAE